MSIIRCRVCLEYMERQQGDDVVHVKPAGHVISSWDYTHNTISEDKHTVSPRFTTLDPKQGAAADACYISDPFVCVWVTFPAFKEAHVLTL